ncbi:class IV adenylate cyclase [Candidatus Saccharibacteria bacterium]|nr:class IV adenylate cyclase [Candidatus Saccharibacteria bacterium]
MQQEIECKFLDVNHDEIRQKLTEIGAVCEKKMRLMRRVMLDHDDNRFQKNKKQERLRVRDEGYKITVTYKLNDGKSNYPFEVETDVGSFDETIKLFEAIGLQTYSYQESKREEWLIGDVEVVLDSWPWINDYIEIEGPTENSIKEVAKKLGFDWNDAKYGSVDTVYEHQYVNFTSDDSIGDVKEVRFGDPLPSLLKKGR